MNIKGQSIVSTNKFYRIKQKSSFIFSEANACSDINERGTSFGGEELQGGMYNDRIETHSGDYLVESEQTD